MKKTPSSEYKAFAIPLSIVIIITLIVIILLFSYIYINYFSVASLQHLSSRPQPEVVMKTPSLRTAKS